MNMFCYQCEQAAKGKGCTIRGVCGKDPDVAALQDLLIHALKGLGVYGNMTRQLGLEDSGDDIFVMKALFATLTNVNFDPERLKGLILEAYQVREKIREQLEKGYEEKHGKPFEGKLPEEAYWKPEETLEKMIDQGRKVGIMADPDLDEDIRSLRELLTYGLKGMAAYAYHASEFGVMDEEVNAFLYRGLAALVNDSLGVNDLVSLNLELGKVNLRCMEILDKAHTEHFGHPVPTPVSLGVKKGPAILVSGHDLLDLEELLKQTEGKGINIYTHGEMLPAHGYPQLKKYKHLAGNYGGAWQDQQKEFDQFPGAILMTTNCIQKPGDSYKDRIFTSGPVAWPGVEHIPDRKDFSRVIDKALELGGFEEDVEDKEIMVGFARNAVLGVADRVIDGVKSGAIRHFFLIGGCDGAKSGRNYYTDLAKMVPQDCVILTLACGKYRFNKLDFGDIGGIPRLLDIGQCNDAYSAIQIAAALSEAFKCSVNELPLSLVLSWYEQKAVCILLTLLALGIKGIRLGPSLPAFVSPNVLKVLVENFDIKPISTPEEDLKAILG